MYNYSVYYYYTLTLLALMHILRLSLVLAKIDFKLKNEGTHLGVLWYLLGPLIMFLILLVVFFQNIGQSIPAYPLYLLLGLILFNFFRQSTVESAQILYDNRFLIKSINFPFETLVGSVVLKMLYVHIFEMIIYLLFLLFFDIPLFGLLFYPIIIFTFMIFSYGLSLLISALSVYFMDLKNIWSALTQALWFLTPIFYTASDHLVIFVFNIFNPVYYFITIGREVIIYNRMPELWLIAGALGFAALSFITGWAVFSRLKYKFSEKI